MEGGFDLSHEHHPLFEGEARCRPDATADEDARDIRGEVVEHPAKAAQIERAVLKRRRNRRHKASYPGRRRLASGALLSDAHTPFPFWYWVVDNPSVRALSHPPRQRGPTVMSL